MEKSYRYGLYYDRVSPNGHICPDLFIRSNTELAIIEGFFRCYMGLSVISALYVYVYDMDKDERVDLLLRWTKEAGLEIL